MPAIGFRIARASAFASLLVFTNLTATGIEGSHVPQVAAASKTKIARPDHPGPFNVGVMVFSATMTGGRTTRVQVFYPTGREPRRRGDDLQRHDGPAEHVDCAMPYRIDFLGGFYELQSPLCARSDARALPGLFPLVVHDHGGPPPGADFQRVAQIPLHEIMASHGFVTAVALHSGDPVVRVRDLTLVIDALLARSATRGDPLAGSIDPSRIGISGISAGAAAAIGAAGGVESAGIPADPRIKAMVVYEPGFGVFARRRQPDRDPVSGYGWVTVAIWSGSSSIVRRNRPGAASNLRPESQRDALQLCDRHGRGDRPNAGSRAIGRSGAPRTVDQSNRDQSSGGASVQACGIWGRSFSRFSAPARGSGRNFCNRVGVDSIRSLDVMPQDGFTDSPPFMATDAFTVNPVIPEEILVPRSGCIPLRSGRHSCKATIAICGISRLATPEGTICTQWSPRSIDGRTFLDDRLPRGDAFRGGGSC